MKSAFSNVCLFSRSYSRALNSRSRYSFSVFHSFGVLLMMFVFLEKVIKCVCNLQQMDSSLMSPTFFIMTWAEKQFVANVV